MKVLLCFDVHSPSHKGRAAYNDLLAERGWLNYIVESGYVYALTNTTLIANKDMTRIVRDTNDAEAAGKAAEIGFVVTKSIITRYDELLLHDNYPAVATPAIQTSWSIAMSGRL